MKEKEGYSEMQKFEYSESEKSFLDKMKSIFHLLFGEKKKNSRHML